MNAARLQAALEWSLAFLALLVIPVLVLEDRAASERKLDLLLERRDPGIREP